MPEADRSVLSGRESRYGVQLSSVDFIYAISLSVPSVSLW